MRRCETTAPTQASPGTDDTPAAPDEAEFDALARRVFAFQFQTCAPYRRMCERRGVTPDRAESWRDIPGVPTAAFKTVDLCCAPAEKIFLTSGTSQGTERRGRHLVPALDLYRTGALIHFRRMVLAEPLAPRVVGLLGGPGLLPDSSLVQMVEWIREDVAGGRGEYLVDEGGFDPARAADRIEAIAAEGDPILLIGVRAVFTALLDHCRQTGRVLALPADSRIVDTGGPKGGRTLSDAGFLNACWPTFSIPGYQCINEYGMTELCSQFYDDVLDTRYHGEERKRQKSGPPWVRTQAVDPTTLAPVPDGEPGILCHLDLANALSVLAVQTEDLGVMDHGRFVLRGRLPGAEPRGCALALSHLLSEDGA